MGGITRYRRRKNGQRLSTRCQPLPGMRSKKITTFSASLSARLELALKIDRNADGIECTERLYQVVGAGTSTIESVPCAIAMVELAQKNRS